MDSEQLSQLDLRLRGFAIENGMSWVVDELDEAISLGLFERRELRTSSRQGQTVYEDVPKTATGGGRRRAEEFVSRRPLTQQEQVHLMLSALRRVLVDLSTVAAASVAQLNDLATTVNTSNDLESAEGPDVARDVPQITEIDFVPDEGSNVAPLTTEDLRHSRFERAASVLSRLKTAVHS